MSAWAFAAPPLDGAAARQSLWQHDPARQVSLFQNQLASSDQLHMLGASRSAPASEPGSFGRACIELAPLLHWLVSEGVDRSSALQLARDALVRVVSDWATASGSPPPFSVRLTGENSSSPAAFVAWDGGRGGQRAVKAFTDSFVTGGARAGQVGLPLGRAAEGGAANVQPARGGEARACVLSVHYAPSATAPHTTKVLISNLPEHLLFVGATAAFLRCAGYTGPGAPLVVAETLGGGSVGGVSVGDGTVVAFVYAPADLLLRSLPAKALILDQSVSLRVQALNSVAAAGPPPPPFFFFFFVLKLHC